MNHLSNLIHGPGVMLIITGLASLLFSRLISPVLFKRLFWAGIPVYAALLILSVVFYKGRTVFLDNSFFLFEMARKNSFSIQRYRFIAALPELLPFFALKWSLSLKAVAISFSAGYMFFYAGCYLVTGGVFRNYKMALVLLLVNTLFVTHAFYWGLSELYLAIGLMVPVFAFMVDKRFTEIKAWQLAIIVVAIATISFAHPLAIIPFMYVVAFLFLNSRLNIDRNVLLMAIVVFVLAYVVNKLFFADAYESASASVLGNFIKLFPDYFTTYSNEKFIQNWFEIYYWIPISLVLITVTYILKRQWRLLAFVLVCSVGYMLLINISYPTSDTNDFYIENMYLPLGMILGLPLVFDVFELLKGYSKYVLALIVVTFFSQDIQREQFLPATH